MKSPREIQDERFIALLKRQLGPEVLTCLDDPDLTDLMINPDGHVWIEAHGRGLYQAHFSLLPNQIEAIIGTVAAGLGIVADADHPIVEGELQLNRIRFEGLIAPVVEAPCIALRKPAQRLFWLKDYVHDGILKPAWAELLSEAVSRKLSVVAVGGTGSGKTTLLGALINEMAERSDPNDRYLVLEDTREIQCKAGNVVFMRTREGGPDLTRLVRAAMRMRPTRIVVGETRGAECLAMLKAWLTGHPGGVTSVHAGSCRGALTRIAGMIQEAGVPPQPELMAETINYLVLIEGTGKNRQVTELARLDGYSPTEGFKLSPV